MQITHTQGNPGVQALMAAISFQDSLIYMLYNANEDDLPNIDTQIPRTTPPEVVHEQIKSVSVTNAEKKFGISTVPSRVASNPINQMWIQGAPPVLINEDAPVISRVLDALACVVRTLVDEAKSRQTKEPITQSSRGRIISRKRKFLSDATEAVKDKSVTEWAVEYHPKELSCGGLLATVTDLLRKEEEASAPIPCVFGGYRILVSALKVMLHIDDKQFENNHETQLLNTCNVLEGIVERPSLLFQGGPTYHIVNNCAIALANQINKIYPESLQEKVAAVQIDKALPVYHGAIMVLEKHRSKLPPRLQCHELPKPDLSSAEDDDPVIDLSQNVLCISRICQDSITNGMGQADAVKRVATTMSDDDSSEKSSVKLQRNLPEPEKEFDINDQALLALLGRIILQEETMM